MCCMAMGTRQSEQASLWVATAELPKSPGHPFYTRLNALLDGADFDRFVEGQCARFYAPMMGRPSLAPGRYFRLLLVGYFEGIDSERGMAWRASDSLAVRSFLRLPVHEPPPDHSTISRTRRAIDLESHRAVFTWVQQRLVAAGLLKGKTVAPLATPPTYSTRHSANPLPLPLRPLTPIAAALLTMPCHHNLETYLQDYIEAAGLAGDRDGSAFPHYFPAHRRSDGSPDDPVRRLAHASAPRAGRRHSDGGLQSHLPRDRHHRLSRQWRLP